MERPISKENLDIESLNGPEVPETQISILEQVTENRASRETRIKNAMKQYEAAEGKRFNEEKRKFNKILA